MSKKLVLKLEIHGEKEKRKALKAVSSLPGIESLAMDMSKRELTVVGDVDPVEVVRKLRKSWCTEILEVGPAKESEKKKEDKKKDDAKKDDDKKKDEKEQIEELVKLYKNYNPYSTQYYQVYSAEENPNACVIS